MWITAEFQNEVEKRARVFYVGYDLSKAWNDGRRAGEPRIMSGWVWASRSSREERTGLKTRTAAYIDAWWHLVQRVEPPRLATRKRIALVAPSKEEAA